MNSLKSMYLSPAIGCNLGMLRWTLFLTIFTALAIALPYACHQFGIAGMVLLPMHFAVILAAVVMGLKGGVLVALISPVLSFSLSGMPPAASLLPMTVELATYAVVINLTARRLKMPLILSLILAMLVGRLVSILLVTLILGNTPITTHLHSIFILALPGIAIQLAFLPPAASKVVNFLNSR